MRRTAFAAKPYLMKFKRKGEELSHVIEFEKTSSSRGEG